MSFLFKDGTFIERAPIQESENVPRNFQLEAARQELYDLVCKCASAGILLTVEETSGHRMGLTLLSVSARNSRDWQKRNPI